MSIKDDLGCLDTAWIADPETLFRRSQSAFAREQHKLSEAHSCPKYQLHFFYHSDMMQLCKCLPVVAAVCCFARAGKLGLKFR